MQHSNTERGIKVDKTIAFSLFFAAISLAPCAADAQSPAWSPEKNVEIVIGAGAGAAADATARAIQRIMQERKLIPVTSSVVNKPGAGYALSWIYINSRPRDGHYLSVTTLALLTNAITGVNPLTYTDVTPVAQLFTDYVVVAVRADSPIKSGKDLVEQLKANPAAASIALAAALGKSVVALFGSENPDLWHPWNVPYRLLQKPSQNVADIPVDEVVQAVEQLMSDRCPSS